MIDLIGKKPNILVVGDLMIDEYFWGQTERISPEAPVQIINISKETANLGGAGNVINNLCELGANVDILSVIGEDSIDLKKLLSAIEINSQYLTTQKDRITSKKTRIISGNQQVLRYDKESIEKINYRSENTIINIFKSIFLEYDSILLSDYGKGVLTEKVTQSIIKIAKKSNIKVLVDPKGKNFSKYKGAYLLTPNRKEASSATSIEIIDEKTLSSALLKLKNDCDLNVSMITLSEQGLAVLDTEIKKYPTTAREVFDVTGAGDTILASLGFTLACGMNIDMSMKFANLAAGVVVGKVGSSTASLNEIIEYESSLNKPTSDKHVKTKNEIKPLIEDLKDKGKKIVFTNGCFDLIHKGHISYLEKAKSFGDVLIIGLNSDRSVRAIKGQDRPINNESDRAYILASIEVVDYVTIFDEDTPHDLIKLIKPHILVKGGDYSGKTVVGQEIADELKLVEYIDGKSSTKTIEKIKKGN
jgi:D-beta-D-heptose 7-phosphate kinase / D-beta-D-heptose 1-phosphate adenosyltransferase